MKTQTRGLRSLNLDSDAYRRRVGKRQAGAACLGGAERESHALKTAYWTLAIVFALSSSLVHAQVATCVAPGCNSVTSDSVNNTAVGTGTLVHLPGGYGWNTALGYQALNQNTTGTANTASGSRALALNTTGYQNTASGYGALYSNMTGYENTASGDVALFSNTTGNQNTASGASALYSNTTGNFNTASGVSALSFNTTGVENTASGYVALELNTTGNDNTATGFKSLSFNTTGSSNTASGVQALYNNTTGSYNTASGMNALYLNTAGNSNTADGYNALYDNLTGAANTASGFQALNRNRTGYHNTAAGFNALFYNHSGNDNTAVGYLALFSNTTGLNNIAIGSNAGNVVTGSNNIDIGNEGITGDGGTIRIGATQSAAYIAGIYDNTSVSGLAVIIDSNGQLGTVSSSERFKTDIEPMGSNTEKLKELRPVTFHYKADTQGTLRYGLIAEEVAQVYPELVVRNQNGRIDGVRYDELAPLLLNEVQQQAAEIRDLKRLVVEMQAGLLKLQAKDQLVAQR